MKRALILLVLPILFWTAPAFAQCANPAAAEGDIIYNTDYNVHQYCNGSAWIAFGALNPGAGGSGCNVPTGIAGDLMYNSAYHVLQYCDGDDWRAVEGTVVTPSGSPSGPAGCPAIGDACPDTTIFVGFSADGDALFIPPTDQGTTSRWKTATGTDDIANDSFIDGSINQSQVAASTTTFPAFKLCNDLTLAGKSWYLPSIGELNTLYGTRSLLLAKAPGNGFTNFQNAYYWSSTEYNTTSSWILNFTAVNITNNSKTTSYRVRCVGR